MTTRAQQYVVLLLGWLVTFTAHSTMAQEPETSAGSLSFAGWGAGQSPPETGSLTFSGWAGLAPARGQLTFVSWANLASRTTGTLQFSGWSTRRDTFALPLSFAGWASSLRPVDTALTFTGWGGKSQEIDLPLLFLGWADGIQNLTGSASFSGYGGNQNEQSAQLRFSGWTMTGPAVDPQLSFEGCAPPEEPEPRIALKSQTEVQAHFAGTDTDRNIDLEGNWIIRWEDAIQSIAYATLTKGGKWQCLGDDACWYQFSRSNDANWEIDMWIPDLTIHPSEATVSATRQISTKFYYGVLGHWGGTSIGTATDTEISGEWTYGDEGGRENWTKVNSTVSAVRGDTGQVVGYGTPVSVTSDYEGPEVIARGNRPGAALSVLGTGLWGRHRWWIPRESGIEVKTVSYLCSDWQETDDSHRDSHSCFSSGDVAGLLFDLTIWSNANPGLHFLYLDNHTIAFQLKLNGNGNPAEHDECAF